MSVMAVATTVETIGDLSALTAAILMFAMVAAAGVKLLVLADLNRRNMLIVALSLGIGQGVAAAPDAVANEPDTIRILLETGIVPAVFVAMALNVVLPDRTARHG